MREIKFRAWDKKEKSMYSMQDIFIEAETGEIWQTTFCKYDTPNTEIELTNRYELMQYTGLKDKNGKEIYEGDIVSCENCYNCFGKIEWNNYSCGFKFMVAYDTYFESEEIADFIGDMKVIGNIYENPELQKGGAK